MSFPSSGSTANVPQKMYRPLLECPFVYRNTGNEFMIVLYEMSFTNVSSVKDSIVQVQPEYRERFRSKTKWRSQVVRKRK